MVHYFQLNHSVSEAYRGRVGSLYKFLPYFFWNRFIQVCFPFDSKAIETIHVMCTEQCVNYLFYVNFTFYKIVSSKASEDFNGKQPQNR